MANDILHGPWPPALAAVPDVGLGRSLNGHTPEHLVARAVGKWNRGFHDRPNPLTRDGLGVIREDGLVLAGERFDPDDPRDLLVQRRKEHRGAFAPHALDDEDRR